MLQTKRILLVPLSIINLEEIEKNTFSLYPISDSLLDDELFFRAVNIKIKNMKNNPQSKHNWLTYWAIINKSNNTIIGFIGFKNYPEDNAVEIGYSLSEQYRRKGFMSEALQLLLIWAKETGLVEKVLADVKHTNTASNQLLLKNEFERYDTDDELYYYFYLV